MAALFIFGWIVLAVVVGYYWQSRGRTWSSGVLASLFLSPVVGVAIGAMLPPNLEAAGTHKKCPNCAELVRIEATVCRFCGRDLPKK